MKYSSSSLGSRCRAIASATLGSALLLSLTSVPPATQVLQVEWSAKRVEEARADSLAMPIHIWNCICVDIAAQPIGVILPNDLSGDPQRTRELLLMLEGVYEEALLGASGQIGAWRDSGELKGIELAWPAEATPVPAPDSTQHLGTIGLVENTSGELLAQMFCFDAEQLAAREAQLQAITGNPLLMEKVWLGPTLLSSAKGGHVMDVSGTGNTVYGDVVTAGDFIVTGDDHNITDQVRFGENQSVSGSGHVVVDLALGSSSIALPGFPQTASSYLVQAILNGTSFFGDITIEAGGPTGLRTKSGVPVSGVVYATGRIYVVGNGLTGSVTLVSQRGVLLSGNENQLTAAVDDVLAVVVGGILPLDRLDNNIMVEGRLSSLEGSLWAPHGMVEVVATGCTLTGRIVAEKIRCSGYENTLSDGCR